MEDYAYINFFGIDGRAAMLACDRHGVTPDVLLFHSKKSFRGNNMEEEQVLIRYTMRERSRQNMLRKLLAVKTSLIVAGTVAGLWKERKELYPDAPKVPKFSKKQLAKAAESVDTESDPDVIDERGRPNPAVMAELERSTSPTPPPSSSPPMQQSPFLLNASNPAPNTEEAPRTQLLASEAASPFAAQHVEHSTPPQPPVEEVPLFQVMVDGMEEEKEATDATHAVEKVPSATSSSSPPKPPQVMHSITSPSVAASTPVVPASSTTSSHKAVVTGSPIHREWSVPAPPTPSSPPAVVQEASLGQTPNTKVDGEAGEAGHNLTPPVVALDVPSLSTNVVVANATSASASAAGLDVDSDHHHHQPPQQQQSPQQHSVVSPPPASQASAHTTSIAATPAAPTPAEEAQASDAPAMSANPRSVTFNNSAVETGALTQTEEEHTVGTTQAFESPSRATPDSQRDGPEAGDRPAGLRPRPPSVCSQTRRERGGEKRASSLHFLQALSERQHQARLSSGMAPHYPSPPPSPPIPYFARNKESLQWEDEELEETQKELAAYGLRAPKQARIFRRYRNDLQARERAERKQQEAQKREKARAAARAAFPTAERPPLCPAAAGPSAKTAPPAHHLEPLIKDSHQKQLEAFRRVAMVDAARNKKNFRKGAMLDKDLEQFATMGTLEHDLQFQASIGKKQPREVVVAAVVQARAAHKKSATRYVDRQWKMEKSLDKRVLRALDKAKTHKQRTEVLHKEVNASRADISRMHREMAERREQRRRHREFVRTERRHHRADEFVHRNDGMALQKRFEHDKEALFRRDIKQKLHAMDTRRDWDLDVLRSMTED